jgi:hypothetical protein
MNVSCMFGSLNWSPENTKGQWVPLKFALAIRLGLFSLNAGEISVYSFEAKPQVLARQCPSTGRMSYMEQNQPSWPANLHE